MRPAGRTGSPTAASSTASKVAKIEMDRKAMSELAIHDPEAFKVLVEKARAAHEAI